MKPKPKNKRNTMNSNQKKLIAQALKNHPGKALSFCGEITNWEESFTIEEVEEKKYLFFWFNLESGHTHTESSPIK